MKQLTEVTIEQNKRFSESCLWQLQRDYFEQEGINAWVSQVPFYVTSNPYIANCYAYLTVHFVRDWITKHPESKKHPFYALELGTGSGRFSFYVLKKIQELRETLGMQDVNICYVMSDFTLANLQYWEEHPSLLPYVKRGELDFALYNLETDESFTLHYKKEKLDAKHLVNPLIVYANYIFDTVSHDIFSVENGKLREVSVSLYTQHGNIQDNKPVDWEKVRIEYTPQEIETNYYDDEHLNKVLKEYKEKIQASSFLFPIGGLRAIKHLRKLANDKLFLIASDKGYSSIESLDHLSYPSLAFHGSFSMMVNFHAIAEYFKNIGGDGFLQTQRKGIKTSVFCSGFKLNDLPETKMALQQHVEGVSAADYFILHRRVSDSFNDCNLDTLASHMALTNWDPYMFHRLCNRITSQLSDADGATVEFLVKNMPKIAANFYHMPQADNAYFDIAVFFHVAKRFQDAIEYYQKAQQFSPERTFGLVYNLALCQFHEGHLADALANFKLALVADPKSKETIEWIGYVESALQEKENK